MNGTAFSQHCPFSDITVNLQKKTILKFLVDIHTNCHDNELVPDCLRKSAMTICIRSLETGRINPRPKKKIDFIN